MSRLKSLGFLQGHAINQHDIAPYRDAFVDNPLERTPLPADTDSKLIVPKRLSPKKLSPNGANSKDDGSLGEIDVDGDHS